MKTSELIRKLNKVVDAYGDLDIVAEIYDLSKTPDRKQYEITVMTLGIGSQIVSKVILAVSPEFKQ